MVAIPLKPKKASDTPTKTLDLYGASVEIFFYKAGTGPGQEQSIQALAKGEYGLGQQGVNFVRSVKVQIDLFRFTQIEIVLSPTFQEAVRLIESGYLGLGMNGVSSKTSNTTKKSKNVSAEQANKTSTMNQMNYVKVRLHYGGLSSSYFWGWLMMPDVNIGVDGFEITLHAVGLMFVGTKTSSGKAHKNKSRQQIIQEIPVSIGDMTIEVEPGDATAKKMLAQKEQFNSAGSDANTWQRLLQKSGCVAVDSGSDSLTGKMKMKVMSLQYMREKGVKGSRSFVTFGQINPNKGVFPILSLSTKIANYMAGITLGLQGSGTDQSSGKKTDQNASGKGIASNAPTVTSQDGKIPGEAPNGAAGKNVSIPVRDSVQNAKDTLKGLAQSLTAQAFQYEITTVGLFDMIPGKLVNVNVGNVKFLSSTYDLIGVTHEISENGAETKLSLSTMFGTSEAISNGAEVAKAKVAAAIGGKNKQSKPALKD